MNKACHPGRIHVLMLGLWRWKCKSAAAIGYNGTPYILLKGVRVDRWEWSIMRHIPVESQLLTQIFDVNSGSILLFVWFTVSSRSVISTNGA